MISVTAHIFTAPLHTSLLDRNRRYESRVGYRAERIMDDAALQIHLVGGGLTLASTMIPPGRGVTVGEMQAQHTVVDNLLAVRIEAAGTRSRPTSDTDIVDWALNNASLDELKAATVAGLMVWAERAGRSVDELAIAIATGAKLGDPLDQTMHRAQRLIEKIPPADEPDDDE